MLQTTNFFVNNRGLVKKFCLRKKNQKVLNLWVFSCQQKTSSKQINEIHQNWLERFFKILVSLLICIPFLHTKVSFNYITYNYELSFCSSLLVHLFHLRLRVFPSRASLKEQLQEVFPWISKGFSHITYTSVLERFWKKWGMYNKIFFNTL